MSDILQIAAHAFIRMTNVEIDSSFHIVFVGVQDINADDQNQIGNDNAIQSYNFQNANNLTFDVINPETSTFNSNQLTTAHHKYNDEIEDDDEQEGIVEDEFEDLDGGFDEGDIDGGFSNYDDWFKILTILKTANIDFEVFNEFSSRSDKYKGHEDCLNYWNNLNIKDISEPLTISSLYEYLKNDNYELYEELQAKIREVCANQIQIEIAELYYIFIENNKKLNRYIYSEQEQTWYYCNENNIWSCSQSVDYPLSLKDDIYKVLKPVFERKASHIIEQIAEKEQEKIPFLTSDNADQAKYNKTEISNINKEIADLNNYKKRAREISKMTGHDTKGRNIMAFLKWFQGLALQLEI
jgi:hypothetical protein